MLDSTKKRTLDVEEKSVGGVQTKMPKIGRGEVNEEIREEKSTEETERKEKTKEPIAKETEDTKSMASTSEPNKKPTTTKSFVFGSTTSFGNMGGFKMFGSNNSNNVFSMSNNKTYDEKTDNEKISNEKTCNEKTGNEKTEDQKQNDEKCKPEELNKSVDKDTTATTATKPISIFGSGSTFGNAFQAAINKKSIFDKTTKETKEDKTDNEKEEDNETDDDDSTSAKDVYKKVHLEKQDIKSGEENEDTIFQIKAKLYHMELSKISNGWKEKGFGIIKVNKLNKCENLNYNSRLIMRQNGNLKLILNLPIIKDFKILKGLPSSLNGNKFVRLQILENGELVQYAIKIGQVENAEKLFETIRNQIPK